MTAKICYWDEVEQLQKERDATPEEQAEIDSRAKSPLEYQRLRAAEYPNFADQFDLLYHGGYDAWKAAIAAVKNKYPKPE